MKKWWYVFDRADCFGKHSSAEAAARNAEDLVRDGLGGIQIRHMCEGEFQAYCRGDAEHREFVEALPGD